MRHRPRLRKSMDWQADESVALQAEEVLSG